MSRMVALLLLLLLVGCGGATHGLRPGTGPHTFRYSRSQGNTPAQSVSGESLEQGLPRAALQWVSPGATTVAEAGTAPVLGEALVAGGAVLAAGGSVVLVCLTVKDALNGTQTPLDIADTFYGTHFGDLQGWVQGCYAPKATQAAEAFKPTSEVKPVSTPHAPPASGRSPHTPNRGRVYATYTKLHSRTGRYYSGRTSMVIDLN